MTLSECIQFEVFGWGASPGAVCGMLVVASNAVAANSH